MVLFLTADARDPGQLPGALTWPIFDPEDPGLLGAGAGPDRESGGGVVNAWDQPMAAVWDSTLSGEPEWTVVITICSGLLKLAFHQYGDNVHVVVLAVLHRRRIVTQQTEG